MLACTVKLVEITDCLHALGQLGAGLGACDNLLGVSQRLLRGNSADPGLAYLGHLVHYIAAEAQLSLFDTLLGDTFAHGQGQQVKQTEGKEASDLRLAA